MKLWIKNLNKLQIKCLSEKVNSIQKTKFHLSDMSIWSLYPQICFIIWFHFFSNAGVNTISSAGISVRSKKFKSS